VSQEVLGRVKNGFCEVLQYYSQICGFASTMGCRKENEATKICSERIIPFG
jgi:hypothetical protein